MVILAFFLFIAIMLPRKIVVIFHTLAVAQDKDSQLDESL